MFSHLNLGIFRLHAIMAAIAMVALNTTLSAPAQDSPLTIQMKDGSRQRADSMSFRGSELLVFSNGTTQALSMDSIQSIALDYSMIRTLKQQMDQMRTEQTQQKQTIEKQNQSLQEMLTQIKSLRTTAEPRSKQESSGTKKPLDDQQRIESLKRQLEQDQAEQQRMQREQDQRLKEEERKRKDEDEKRRRAALDNEVIIYQCSHCGNTFARHRKDGPPLSSDGPTCVDRSGKKRATHMWQKQN
ncbi:MAG: hypothetical protein NTX50_09020 [Candidatus Sumerlaeota bacterium]|nr:hypothetical protein [Candidatus Sumerlaeota bacterium]